MFTDLKDIDDDELARLVSNAVFQRDDATTAISVQQSQLDQANRTIETLTSEQRRRHHAAVAAINPDALVAVDLQARLTELTDDDILVLAHRLRELHGYIETTLARPHIKRKRLLRVMDQAYTVTSQLLNVPQ